MHVRYFLQVGFMSASAVHCGYALDILLLHSPTSACGCRFRLSLALRLEMDVEWSQTLIVNETDREIKITYGSENYILKPNSVIRLSWNDFDAQDTLLPFFCLQGVKLEHSISQFDLYDNKVITIVQNG